MRYSQSVIGKVQFKMSPIETISATANSWIARGQKT